MVMAIGLPPPFPLATANPEAGGGIGVRVNTDNGHCIKTDNRILDTDYNDILKVECANNNTNTSTTPWSTRIWMYKMTRSVYTRRHKVTK